MAARKRSDYQEEVKKLLSELDFSAAEIAKQFDVSRRMVYYIAGTMGLDMDDRTRRMRLQRQASAITEEMVTRAYRVLLEEISPPYSADVRDFSDEDIKAGKLKIADDEAEKMNRAFVRRVLEAAYSGEEMQPVSPCETTTEEEIIHIRFEGRCFFYPARDCKGWVYDGKCGRIGRQINKEEDLEAAYSGEET